MRAEILGAFYTILLGNPTLKKPRDAPMRTRFKMWWRLVGSAVEHAARLADPDHEVDFQKLFLAREDEDEETTSLAEALSILSARWPMTFDAADVALFVNDQTDPRGTALREFLYPGAPPNYLPTPKSVGRLLKNHMDEPVKSGDRTLTLRKHRDPHNRKLTYFVHLEGG